MATPYQRSLYEENKDLFMIVFRLGNKIALQNQLRILCLNLKLYIDTKEFNDVVKELCEAKLFSYKYDTYNSKSNLLIIENPVLSWIYKELKEQGINVNKARVKTTPNERIDKSLFKIQYAILFLKRHPDIKSVNELLEELEKETNILYTEKRGLEYFNSFLKNNHVLNISEDESKDMFNELIMENKRQKASVPSRKGKGKKFTELKSKDILVNYAEGETPSEDVKTYLSSDDSEDKASPKKVRVNNDEGTIKEKVVYNNNFNSFLERGCLLKLNKINIHQESIKNKRMDIAFTLYIFDINKKLNPIKVAEKTSRAYLMLYNLLRLGYKERDSSICKTCPKNIHSPNYKHVNRNSRTPGKGEKDLAKFYYVCEPGNHNNRDYLNCEDNTVHVRRNIYMNVKIVTWSDERMRKLLTDCNYIEDSNYLSTEEKYTEFQKRCMKEGLDSLTVKKFKVTGVNFNLENLYLGGKSRANITKKNKKASLKKTIKEEIKETGAETGVSLEKETIEKMADVMVAKILEKIEL